MAKILKIPNANSAKKGKMMRTKLFFIMTSLCLLLSGCAHHLMRGSVAMKTGDREAHVCMGKGEVKVGDRVAVFKNNCRPKSAGSCEKVRTGEGTVTQVLNEIIL